MPPPGFCNLSLITLILFPFTEARTHTHRPTHEGLVCSISEQAKSISLKGNKGTKPNFCLLNSITGYATSDITEDMRKKRLANFC